MGPISMTSEREEVVDFTTKWMEDSAGILTLQPWVRTTAMFKIYAPFSYVIWLTLLGATLAVSLAIYGINHFSPFAQSDDSNSSPNPRSFVTNLWLVFGSFVEQGRPFVLRGEGEQRERKNPREE